MEDRVIAAGETFIANSLSELRRFLGGGSIPRYLEPDFRFSDNGGYVMTTVNAVDWMQLIELVRNLLQQKATLDFVRICFEDGAYHGQLPLSDSSSPIPSPVPFEKGYMFALVDFEGMLRTYVEEGGLEFDPARFASILDRYRESWSYPTRRLRESLPLQHLEADLDSVVLSDGYRLERLSAADRNRIWSALQMPAGWFPLQQLAVAQYHITRDVELDRLDVSSRTLDRFQRFARNALTALRLTRPGNVGAFGGVTFPHPSVPKHSTDARWSSFRLEEGAAVTGEPFSLTRSDLDEVRNTIRQLDNEKSRKEIDVAARRFNLSYGRAIPEDILIDVVIGLEASLLSGGNLSGQQLSYRLALRGAALLAESRSAETTFKTLRDYYNLRSTLVHAGKTFDQLYSSSKSNAVKAFVATGRPYPELAVDARQLLREIIVEYLRGLAEHQSLDQMNDALDTAILGAIESWKKK